MTYVCGDGAYNDTAIVCSSLQPSLVSRDDNRQLTVVVANPVGTSSSWYVVMLDNGPYSPPSPDDPTTRTTLDGMDLVTFVVVLSIAAVVVLFILSLGVLACCCGVPPSTVLRCCRSGPGSSYSSVAVPVADPAPLLQPAAAYGVDAPLVYPSSPCRLGLSLPPDPSHNPAVSTRGVEY